MDSSFRDEDLVLFMLSKDKKEGTKLYQGLFWTNLSMSVGQFKALFTDAIASSVKTAQQPGGY